MEIIKEMKADQISREPKLEEMTISQDQFEEMKTSQDSKFDDIKDQLRNQEQKVECVINELKRGMEDKMKTLKEK